MDSTVITAFIITLIAGLSTAIGACITFFIRKNDFKLFALGMSFSAGVMIYLSFVSILPIACEYTGQSELFGEHFGHFFGVLMFFLGTMVAGMIDFLVPTHMHGDELGENISKGNHNHNKLINEKYLKKGNLRRVAIMTAAALALHNFPEGLSVFVTSLQDINFGLTVGFAIILHNIPEGIAVALPIYDVTGSKKKAVLFSSLSGLAEPLGAIVAYLFLMPYLNTVVIGSLLSLTAGIMVYISLDELLPMSREYAKSQGAQHYGIIGAISGMAVIASLAFLFE